MPHLTDHDLRQMDEAWLQSLAEPVARAVLSRVVEDLKEARDRLNQNSENSSRPPGSRLPWEDRRLAEAEEDGEATGCAEPRSSSVLPAGEAVADVTSGADEASPRRRVKAPSGRKPGQQPGVEGHGRTQKLVVYEVEHRHPAVCAACGAVLAPGAAYTGWDTIDVLPLAAGEVGLKLGVTRHLLHEAGCACGHRTRAGHDQAPLETELVAEIEQAALVHADETSWREAGQALWLWVFVTAQTVLYQIGYRTQEIVINVLSAAFQGDLMTDGYAVYRSSPNRLRCWAHLMRKLVGLSESTHQRVAGIGQQLHAAFSGLQDAIYTARGSGDPPGALAGDVATAIKTFRHTLERHRDDPHEKQRAVAREFLRDWEVILRPLSDPSLPLTNNEAERTLRHYVIARRISHGTRSELGSRAYALLASVIETCRSRGAVVLDFLGSVIAAARKGLALPSLPEMQTAKS